MELVSLNEGPENSVVCSVTAELGEKLATCEPKNGPHQDYGKQGSPFISHQVYGKLVYHPKETKISWRKAKETRKKQRIDSAERSGGNGLTLC